MSKRASLLLAGLLVLVLSGASWACTYEFTGDADCEGWTVTGWMHYGTPDCFTFNYEVRLMQGTTEVDYITGSKQICSTVIDPTHPIDLGTLWNIDDLCGDFVAEIHVNFICNRLLWEEDYRVPFTCECDGGYGCGTPGYWKNHDDWPVENLLIGNATLSKMALMEIFDMPTRGRIMIKLTHHLIAAKLNALRDGDDSMDGVFDEADQWVIDWGYDGKPKGDDKYDAEDVKDLLKDYNENCPPDEEEMMPTLESARKALEEPADSKSWGAIKKYYK
jgi:hypothetical protein